MNAAGMSGARTADDDALAGVIAAVRATSALSQPARVDILLTRGVEAPVDEVFGHTLINPERDRAVSQARGDLQQWQVDARWLSWGQD